MRKKSASPRIPRPAWTLPSKYGITGAVLTSDVTAICVPGYSKKLRPPAKYTDALKRKQMKQFNLPGPASAYEEDHLVSLELGGDPRSPNNLWPQPIAEAKEKDRLENFLHKQICAGKLNLADVQKAIAADWVALWTKFHAQFTTASATSH